MNINIDDIVINNRKRKLNNDKVRELAESFKLIGQLEPITITSDNVLLAGWHRVEAAKMLGWKEIKAEQFEGNELERELAEIDENLMRNDLTVLEQGEHLARRQELIGFSRGGDRRSNGNDYRLKTTSEIGREIGLSEKSVRNRMQAARNIVPEVKEAIRDTEIADSTTQLLELARLAPEKQIEVLNYWDGEKPISEVMRKINRENKITNIIEKAAEKRAINELGIYSVIYADPPWSYDHPISDSRRIENQYPTMSIDEICALDVPSISADDAILFLWVTTPMLEKGFRVLNAWGFEYRTSMVWVKPSIGMGQWVRQRHELLLIGVKGNIPTPRDGDKPDSVIEAPRLEHSKKPEIVYEIIEKMYPELPKVELFSRNKRNGWETWGFEA